MPAYAGIFHIAEEDVWYLIQQLVDLELTE
jgi:hypothetical protein